MRERSEQEKYLNEVFGLSDPELEPVRRRLEAGGVDFMALSGFEARLLRFLVRALGVKTIVEVGTLYGYSALCLAGALPEGGHLWTIEKNEAHWRAAGEAFRESRFGSRITSLRGEALSELEKLDGPFDMCFIDANKGGYLEYLDWAERNVRRGGLIVGDNTFLWGGVYGTSRNPNSGPTQIETMRAFNARLADPTRYDSTLIPTSEGLTIGIKLF